MAPLRSLDFDGLVNEAERLVREEMQRQLPQQRQMCTCDECLLDIAAFALNQVRPRYRVSLLDRVLADRDEAEAYAREVRRAVAEAILRIRTNPPHD